MIRLQRRPSLAAVSARPVPELKKPYPLDRRVRAPGSKLPSLPASSASLTRVTVFASVLRKVGGQPPLVAFVMRPDIRGVFIGMSLPPPTHRLPGFLRIALDPLAAVLTPPFGVFIGHGPEVAAVLARGNRTQQKGAALAAAPQLRGNDSNVRPSGYEPDELPLLHPAT